MAARPSTRKAPHYTAPAPSTVARAVLADPTFLATLDLFDQPTADSNLNPGSPRSAGRPRSLPDAVYWYVNVCVASYLSHRKALAETRAMWPDIRPVFAAMTDRHGNVRYPVDQYPGLAEHGTGPSWGAYGRWRQRHAAHGPTEPLLEAAARGAVDAAVTVGGFDPAADSWTRPSPLTAVQGDGIVLAARSTFTPGVTTVVHPVTGEITRREFRHDPHAHWHAAPKSDKDDPDMPAASPKRRRVRERDKGVVYGLKFCNLHFWNGHSGESISLGTTPIPGRNHTSPTTRADEQQGILTLVDRVRRHVPDSHLVRTLVYDGAARGVWASNLYDRSMLLVSKARYDNAKRRTYRREILPVEGGRHTARCTDGKTRNVLVVTSAQRPHVVVHSGGHDHDIPLHRVKVAPVSRVTSAPAFWGTFRIPDDPRVQKPLRGALIRIRLDRSDADLKTVSGPFNRPEHLRPIFQDPDDPVWTSLMTRRPFSESFNSQHKDKHSNNGRRAAPSWGYPRNHWDMVCHQIWHNARALLVHADRVARETQRDTAAPSGSPPDSSAAA